MAQGPQGPFLDAVVRRVRVSNFEAPRLIIAANGGVFFLTLAGTSPLTSSVPYQMPAAYRSMLSGSRALSAT